MLPVVHLPSPPPPRLEARLGAWVGAGLGAIPGVSFGTGIDAALHLGRYRFDLGVQLRPPRAATIASRPTAGGDVALVAARFGACGDLLGGRVALGPCARVELGALTAAGFGVDTPREAARFWAALGLGGRLAIALNERLGVGLRVEAAVPFFRPRFYLDDLGVVFRPSAVVGSTELGAEVRF